MKTILVTGGMGYIGSHTVVTLIEQGFEPIIFDDLSNSSDEVLNRIEIITGTRPTFVQGSINNSEALNEVFSVNNIEGVIHFAGLKAVGESVSEPIRYYQNNVCGSVALFNVMANSGCKNIVFSSSATVYGDPKRVPIKESFPLGATNPYGQSKLMIENILKDICASDDQWNASILRYFNPISAHSSGLIGDNPLGVPNNLMPYISKVSAGVYERLTVFGDDYDTPDGTGVRDYIHVMDLADAHLCALNHINQSSGWRAYNIGTGQGYSVLEVVRAFEASSGVQIPMTIAPRRDGDIATSYADASVSKKQLNWVTKYGIREMMRDEWRWQSNNNMS